MYTCESRHYRFNYNDSSIVLLNDVVCARVELDNLLIRHADQETVVVRFIVPEEHASCAVATV